MKIIVSNQTNNQSVNSYRGFFALIAENLLTKLQRDPNGTATVIFVDDQTMSEYNEQYRGLASSTDVLSFAYHDQPDLYQTAEEIDEYLGDILISVPTMIRQAADYGHSEKRETLFLFLHGLLHLLGYDHQNPADQQVMFGLQKEVLDEIAPKV